MSQRYTKVNIRNAGRKKVKISSGVKPEITSSIIQKWQSLIDVAAKIVNVPSGLIMKLNEDSIEVFVKSNTEGNPYKAGEKAKLIYGLYCETVIGTQNQLLVPDATKSKVWNNNNPDVDINMISYLGLPINWPDGEVFGTVCLLDNKENHYSGDYGEFLKLVKTQIETDLQLLLANQELAENNRELKQTIESSETLKNSDKRFRIIFENSLAVMLLIEPETHRIVAANNAAEKFYGWKRSEIESMRVDDINTLSFAEIKAEMAKAHKSERIYFRFKHRLANGDVRDVEVYSGKVEIEGFDYLHSIIHDITEQVKAEEALKNNEKVLRLFVEHSPASIAMFDTQMRYLVYSKRFLSDYDLGKRNIVGLSHYEVFPEIPQRWKDIHQRGLKGEILSADNDPFPRANGKMDWIRWEIHPWYKNENEIGGIILFSEVITERKNADEALRNSEAYNRMLFEQSQIGLALADMDGKLMDINSAYAAIIGRTIDETKQLTYWEITPENYTIQEQEQLESLKKTGRYGPYEKEYIHKDGYLVPVRLQGLIIERDGKKFIWSSVEDISEQKKATEEKNKLSTELSDRNKFIENVLDNIPLGVAVNRFDEGTATYINNEFENIYGWPKNELVDISNFFKKVYPDEKYREEIQHRIMKDIATGDRSKMHWEDIEITTQSGEKRIVNAQNIPLFEQNLMISTVLDVTEKKHAEETLRKSEERFRVAQEFSPDGFTILHPLRNEKNEIVDFTWVYENKTIARINNINPEEVKGKRLLELFPTHKGTTVFETYIDVANSGEPKILEEIYVGEVISVPTWLRLVIVPMEGDIAILAQNVTERKKAEEELFASEERFRTMVEGAPDPIFIQIDHKFAYLNKPALKLFGAGSEAGMLGKTVLEFIHPDFRKLALKRIRKLNEQKESVLTLLEQKFIRLNGDEVWVETSGEPIFYNGKHGGLVFVRDISERKKAEEALSHSHELMKYIIEHNQSAVAVHDKNLNYVYVSQRYLNDYRITDKNIIGKHHYEVFPDLPEKWRKVHQKALLGVVSKADDDKFIREDGLTDWTRWECRPWYEADGSIGGIIVYTEVINEQKRKEEEIRKLNQRLGILIESIQQLSSAQSLISVQDIVAKSARKLIGADGATLVFRENDHCFYVNEDAIKPLWKGKKFPMNSCISGWVMENKKTVVIEDIFSDDRIPKDLYSATFVKSLAMVPVNISEPIGAIGNYWKETYTPTETEMQLLQTLADSAARSIENIQLYNELENRVKLRTTQLQAANKELETFTYSVSHDLKAPLRGIDGYSKLLLEEYGNSLNEEAAHFIKTIRSSTLQMNQLIDDLLSYSRLERNVIKKEKIVLKPFVESLVGSYSNELKAKNFTVDLQIPESELVADATGLSIALRNYLENAIKFTGGKPNPKIEIGLEEKHDTWIISVKDNGTGFDMKYHDRIFEIFQRLHLAEDFPGTGIGLAMVAKALQRMNGKAWAESSPGQGSTFFIELPKIDTI